MLLLIFLKLISWLIQTILKIIHHDYISRGSLVLGSTKYLSYIITNEGFKVFSTFFASAQKRFLKVKPENWELLTEFKLPLYKDERRKFLIYFVALLNIFITRQLFLISCFIPFSSFFMIFPMRVSSTKEAYILDSQKKQREKWLKITKMITSRSSFNRNLWCTILKALVKSIMQTITFSSM